MGINNPIPRSLKSETKYVVFIFPQPIFFRIQWMQANICSSLQPVSVVDKILVTMNGTLTIILIDLF